MSRLYDLAIVGAGPAGLAAASTATSLGLATIVFDESPSPGGQIYRALTTTPVRRPEVLGRDYWEGGALVRPFRSSGAEYLPGTTVLGVTRRDDRGFDLDVSGGRPGARIGGTFSARALIVAVGAMERPMPFAGWTLPGVMTAGAVQALLKASALVPQGRVVFAGAGPLLWQVAWQLTNAGARIDTLLETIPRGRLAEAMRHAPGFMFSSYLARGLDLVRTVRRRTHVVEHVEALEAAGDGAVQRVRYRADGDATWVELPADVLVLSHGVVANIHLPAALGCELAWNGDHSAFQTVTDAWGGTSVESVWVAGDAAGVAGAEAAVARGRLAALGAANALGRIDAGKRDAEATKPAAALAHALRGRPFLDALYRPSPAWRQPGDDTIVCRCEEITAGRLRTAVRDGATTQDALRTATGCGTGPCHGRWCLLTATEILATETGTPPSGLTAPAIRFPLRPVGLPGVAIGLPRADAGAGARAGAVEP